MKYILALGLIFVKYRKPMSVTIGSSQLIDDFSVDEDIIEYDEPVVWPHNFYDEVFTNLVYNLRDSGGLAVRNIPKKIFFYEVDETALGDMLQIDVDCESNNYTNGFMTQTSLHKLRMVCIVPKTFLLAYCGSKGTHRAIQRLHQRSSATRLRDPNSIWPYNRKNWQIDADGQKLNDAVVKEDVHCLGWIGGKTRYSIPIIKKFGIKMLDPYHKKRYGRISSNFFCYKQIFEKYYQLNMCNEDQRSDTT